jgi:hypothetical protein
MKKGFYRTFFQTVTEVVNLCVAILAIVGLLVAVGFFKFQLEPELKLLKPAYAFDMSKLIAAFQANAPSVSVPAEWIALTNQFVNLRSVPTKNLGLRNPTFSLPFAFSKAISDSDSEKYVIKPSDPTDIFYQLGMAASPSNYSTAIPNFSSKRTDEEKRTAVIIPISFDEMTVARERGLEPGRHIEENPLLKLQSLMPHTDHPQFADTFRVAAVAEATFVYSIVSVANMSSEPIENIRVSIPTSTFSGGVMLIGWSNIPQFVDATEKNKNYHIMVERLDPNQSIEIVFRGHKALHRPDVGITSTWTFDKTKVGIFVFATMLLALAIFFGDHLELFHQSYSVLGV